MAMDDEAGRQPLESLSNLLDDALRQLATSGSAKPMDGLLYSGNRHESVPRRLFFDRRLTPLERNAWQVFRLQITGDDVTALPTYDEVRPWLASMPCGAQASHETVARALTLLRLTRWLSLVRRRRDAATGRVLGNLYVLHDEPLTPFEAMQLDPDYLELVSQSLSHSGKAVQIVAAYTLKEVAEDPLLGERTLPSRLKLLSERMTSISAGHHESYPQQIKLHDSEDGADTHLRNRESPSSESEAGLKPTSDGSLRNPKTDSTVRSKNKIRTVPRARKIEGVHLPEHFERLSTQQQNGALMALQQVPVELRQAVLDDWAQRCQSQAVRNPAGYLFGMIQRAIRGEFNAWAQPIADTEEVRSMAMPAEAEPPPQNRKGRPAVAREYIDQLRDLLREK